MTTAKTIGENIRKFRILRGWTQQQLARRCGGRNVTQINAYERARSRPSEPVLNELAQTLGVKPEELTWPEEETTVAEPGGGIQEAFQEAKALIARALGISVSELRLRLEIES